jgi:hypothetical protein
LDESFSRVRPECYCVRGPEMMLAESRGYKPRMNRDPARCRRYKMVPQSYEPDQHKHFFPANPT